jgi:hypothetical protein
MTRLDMTCFLCAAALVTLQACQRPVAVDLPTGLPVDPGPQTLAPAAQAEAPAAPAAPARPIPAAQDLSDGVITGRIKASLATDPALAGADVSVNTDRGVVNLAGSVRSYEQLALASAHAQQQDGVMRIESHVAVLNP